MKEIVSKYILHFIFLHFIFLHFVKYISVFNDNYILHQESKHKIFIIHGRVTHLEKICASKKSIFYKYTNVLAKRLYENRQELDSVMQN